MWDPQAYIFLSYGSSLVPYGVPQTPLISNTEWYNQSEWDNICDVITTKQ